MAVSRQKSTEASPAKSYTPTCLPGAMSETLPSQPQLPVAKYLLSTENRRDWAGQKCASHSLMVPELADLVYGRGIAASDTTPQLVPFGVAQAHQRAVLREPTTREDLDFRREIA